MFAGASLTSREGLAQDYLTLGPDPGENVVEVRAVHCGNRWTPEYGPTEKPRTPMGRSGPMFRC